MPGDKPEEKMRNFPFTLEEGLMAEEDPSVKRPKVISEAVEVIECTWLRGLGKRK